VRVNDTAAALLTWTGARDFHNLSASNRAIDKDQQDKAMAKYRHQLPQISDRIFLTDGGMETTLVFHDGIDLPCFAAFDLLKTKEGTAHARRYYERYITLAKASGLGFILESPTWRASRDWGAKIGYSVDALADMNRRAIGLMTDLRDQYERPDAPMVISGNVGPRGDGYVVENAMSAKEAADYHGEQIGVFADTEADMVSAFTINYADEAIGVANAARKAGMPVVISFTLETDGRLPTGQTLKDAIEETDAATGRAGLLHDQLRASDAFFRHPQCQRRLGEEIARPARQCLAAQPRGTRPGQGSRCRRSGRARAALRGIAPQAAASHDARRLLRHRSPPC
jgi:S-methylmethionine-dependent homocysteine/selenocysteine methylase